MEDQNERPYVEVCFSPRQFPLYKDPHDIIVVIDVLRATSAICAAFEHGVEAIIPVSSIEEARDLQDQGYLAAAERNGEIVDGFEFGNSPFSYMTERTKGKTVALSTTNGTRAINIAKVSAKTVVIGALSNLDALTDWLIKQERNVLCLCSGWKDKFNLEDTICAGAIADALMSTGNFQSTEDSSIAAKYLYQSARDNYFGFLKSSSHRRRLKKLNLNEDIKFCLTPNQTQVIPILKGDRLTLLNQE